MIGSKPEPMFRRVDIHVFPFVRRWLKESPKVPFADFMARQDARGVDVSTLNGQVELMTELAILFGRVERWHEVISLRHKTKLEPYLRRWYSPDELKRLDSDIGWVMTKLNGIM